MHRRETEIKLRITDVPAMRKQLRTFGFVPIHRRTLEDNVLYDTPDRKLRQVRSLIRLRHYGARWVLTYKDTPDPDQHYKSRAELETEIQEPQAIRSILEVLGLQPVFRYQKYRAHYRERDPARPDRPGGEVALDETPVGNFLELEGSRAWIDRVARQLGYSRSDYTTASYGALYREECRKQGLPPGDMLFAEPPGRNRRKARQAQK